MQDNSNTTSRRELLKGALAAGVVVGVAPILQAVEELSSTVADRDRGKAKAIALPQRDLIRAENAKPGTTDWLLTNTRVDRKSKYRCPWIEGYCSRTSLRAGEKLAIMVSTNPPSPYVIDIYRMGYYGGKGGRFIRQLGPFQGSTQPDPEIGPERLRECQWEPAVEFMIPAEWPSGVYLGKMTAEREGRQSYVIFIVRDDRPCDFLFQCSDATWSAYNRWPSQWSLYDDGHKKWYCGPNVRVSFDRPYGMYSQVVDAKKTQGSGEFLLWEYPLAFWMEKEGYDVSYISNVDTHADGAGLLRAKAFISVGHDEYWSREMYDNMLAAVGKGLSAGFFGGDTCWGVVPFWPNSAGAEHRVITRLGQFGKIDPRSMQGGHDEIGLLKELAPTQAHLIGARCAYPFVGIADWICSDESHWIYADSGMKNGDRIANLIGWESMGEPADMPGLKVVAKGPMIDGRGNGEGEYTATVYPGSKNNWVFNAATIWWANALIAPPGYQTPAAYGGSPPGPDPRVERITANLFARFRGTG
jgi:hypothetical protein